ncbi:MAG: M43 family zinc metalloprotease, partial [Bacteroidota bacterium]
MQRIIQQGNVQLNRSTYTVPVVVHVIHSGQSVGSTYNITDAQINSGIEWLNNHFANSDGAGGQMNASGVDVGITFTLATLDPNCNPTTGINRINGSGVTNYTASGVKSSGSVGAAADDIRDLARWNPDYYINIWVVNTIDEGTVLGFTVFSSAPDYAQGIFVQASAFGYDPGGTNAYYLGASSNLNTTITHEMGHYFDLYHTFEGSTTTSCTDNTDCATQGDRVCDTKPHIIHSNYTDPGGNPYCFDASYGVEENICVSDGSTLYEVAQYYMDYSNQECQNRFTDGQKTRMLANLLSDRAGLITGVGFATAPGSYPIAATCTPST